jgi:hypothetical protein
MLSLLNENLNDVRFEMKASVWNPWVSDSGAGSRWLIVKLAGAPDMKLN